jgi:hypothetical protein
VLPIWHLIVEQKTIEGSISDDAQGFKHNSNSLAGSCSFADRSQTSMGLQGCWLSLAKECIRSI